MTGRLAPLTRGRVTQERTSGTYARGGAVRIEEASRWLQAGRLVSLRKHDVAAAAAGGAPPPEDLARRRREAGRQRAGAGGRGCARLAGRRAARRDAGAMAARQAAGGAFARSSRPRALGAPGAAVARSLDHGRAAALDGGALGARAVARPYPDRPDRKAAALRAPLRPGRRERAVSHLSSEQRAEDRSATDACR